jgi:hypothetical protein
MLWLPGYTPRRGLGVSVFQQAGRLVELGGPSETDQHEVVGGDADNGGKLGGPSETPGPEWETRTERAQSILDQRFPARVQYS